jgi:hypothetical protein
MVVQLGVDYLHQLPGVNLREDDKCIKHCGNRETSIQKLKIKKYSRNKNREIL